ncbi:MAG: hypothetical protein VKL39_17365 [Leptolyngbyaceae bacterium]|nr:hypothetical protein [Leptolyngbyaceae bacterium]
MTGFIRGLFGRNQANSGNDKEAYYLNPDDAKTFGDIDYMRSSKTVKRTFAKGDPRVRQISALKDEEVNGSMSSSSTSSSAGAPIAQKPFGQTSFGAKKEDTTRRAADSNMDMFRNMAKEIRKR